MAKIKIVHTPTGIYYTLKEACAAHGIFPQAMNNRCRSTKSKWAEYYYIADTIDKKHRAAYHCQKNGAKKRGIAWQFTLEEWINWWGNDIDSRGPYANQLVMARYGDTGPYASDNVFKCTASENCKQREELRYGLVN